MASFPSRGRDRRGCRQRRGRPPSQRRTPGGQGFARRSRRCGAGREHKLLTGLDGRTVGEAIRLKERRERDAVALGNAVEGIAVLYLDRLPAPCRLRAIYGPTAIVLTS